MRQGAECRQRGPASSVGEAQCRGGRTLGDCLLRPKDEKEGGDSSWTRSLQFGFDQRM